MGRRPKPPPVAGEKPDLEPEVWKGAALELLNGFQLEPPHFPNNAAQVATAAGISPQAVRKRRKNPRYLAGVFWILREALADPETRRVPGAPSEGTIGAVGSFEEGMVYVNNVWQEPDPANPDQLAALSRRWGSNARSLLRSLAEKSRNRNS